MSIIRTSLIAAASALAMGATVQAQTTSPDTKAEMDRGVPGVDVDVGRNAQGAIDIKRENSETARGVPGVDVDTGRNARGAVDVDVDRGARAPRADRN